MATSHAKRLPDIVALLALCATCWLIAPVTSAHAATNAKQRVTHTVKKHDAKKREPIKPAGEPALETEARKDAPKQAAKKQDTKKQAAKKGKPVKQAAKARRGKKPVDDDDDDEDEKKPSAPPLTGDRAEARLWQEKADNATIRTFFADKGPLTAKGRFALARQLMADGDRLGAAREVKAAWRVEELGEATEEMAYEEFKDLLAREDHRARMDKRIGAKELGAAMRAAKRLGDAYVSIVKACSAVKGDADKALSKLNDVPDEARADLGYVLCRDKWAIQEEK